jgi:hypothetical protein
MSDIKHDPDLSTQTMTALMRLGTYDFPYFLSGDGDLDLYLICFSQENKRTARSESDLNLPEILEAVDSFKDKLRRYLQSSIESEAKNFMEAERRKMIKQSKALHVKSKYGTVAEMAEQLSVSKSKIRKLKRNGDLELLFGE